MQRLLCHGCSLMTVGLYFNWKHKKRAWELFCRSSHPQGFSHRPVLKNEQRRSPRRYAYINPKSVPLLWSCYWQKGCVDTHPEDIHRCLALTMPFEFCENSEGQRQDARRRLFICLSLALPQAASERGERRLFLGSAWAVVWPEAQI